jgi:predicted nucleic-acid-binding protein
MIGFDTNVLVRYLVSDDARQAALAEAEVERARLADDPIFLPAVVLCELVWVLRSVYGSSKLEVAGLVELILRTKLFQVEADLLVRRALDSFRAGKGDFADYMISETCRREGCDGCRTFDHALAGSPGFTVLR